jgi:hypothetical protein
MKKLGKLKLNSEKMLSYDELVSFCLKWRICILLLKKMQRIST